MNVTIAPTASLADGALINIHGEVPAGTAGTMSNITAHICITPPAGPINNTNDFGFAGPYCVKSDGIQPVPGFSGLGAGTLDNYETTVVLANTTSGDLTFTAGSGAVAWLNDSGLPLTLTCDAAHPCDLVVQFQLSVAPFTTWFATPLTYAGGTTTTGPPATTTTTTGPPGDDDDCAAGDDDPTTGPPGDHHDCAAGDDDHDCAAGDDDHDCAAGDDDHDCAAGDDDHDSTLPASSAGAVQGTPVAGSSVTATLPASRPIRTSTSRCGRIPSTSEPCRRAARVSPRSRSRSQPSSPGSTPWRGWAPTRTVTRSSCVRRSR